MTENEQTAGIGDNIPPEPINEAFDALQARTSELVDAANAWLNDCPTILTEDQAGRASDFVSQLTKQIKAVEDERKKQKQPHVDAAKAVDNTFRPLTTMLDTAKQLLRPVLTRWLQKKEQERQEAERAAAAEAERLRKEAEEAARKAEEAKGNVVGATIAAEQAKEDAEEADKQAQQVSRSRVGIKGDYSERSRGLRTVKRAEITDLDKALNHYKTREEVRDLIIRLASADARAGAKRIPGIKIVEERKAA